MADASFTPRARFLGAELRSVREQRGIGVRQLAKLLGLTTHSRISLWELGKKIPAPEDVAAYLTALGVSGEERDRLVEQARSATQPNWLASGLPGVAEELGALMEIEKTARQVFDWSPMLIPGLLQTGDYARAIMGDLPAADTSVAMRLARRDILTRRTPAELVALIGESALRQPIGEPEVMVAQLQHLIDSAAMPTVTVQVVPARTPWHPGLVGPFVLVEFHRAPPIVHLEHHRASAFVVDEADVTAYQDLAQHMREEVAMSPDQSKELIAEVIHEETT